MPVALLFLFHLSVENPVAIATGFFFTPAPAFGMLNPAAHGPCADLPSSKATATTIDADPNMKAIIFDLGNVLIDYDHQRTLAAMARLYGMDPEQISAAFDQVGAAFGLGEMDTQEFHHRMDRLLGHSTDGAAFEAAFNAGPARNDAALAYAVALQQHPGVTVAAISNTNQLHVAWIDANAPELNQLDLVMMSNEVGMAKPDPAIFRLALELLDLPAGQTLFVDDLAENVEAARHLGMAGIVHTTWHETRPLIEAWLAT